MLGLSCGTVSTSTSTAGLPGEARFVTRTMERPFVSEAVKVK